MNFKLTMTLVVILLGSGRVWSEVIISTRFAFAANSASRADSTGSASARLC